MLSWRFCSWYYWGLNSNLPSFEYFIVTDSFQNNFYFRFPLTRFPQVFNCLNCHLETKNGYRMVQLEKAENKIVYFDKKKEISNFENNKMKMLINTWHVAHYRWWSISKMKFLVFWKKIKEKNWRNSYLRAFFMNSDQIFKLWSWLKWNFILADWISRNSGSVQYEMLCKWKMKNSFEAYSKRFFFLLIIMRIKERTRTSALIPFGMEMCAVSYSKLN